MEHKHVKNNSFIRTLKLIAVVIIFFVSARYVDAATLNVSPSSGSHAVGDSFSVYVTVSSSNQSVNAADGTLSYPSDKLSIDSISKDDSIFNIWTEEPSFSNSSGTVDFSGVILNPGYMGSNGKILRVNFRVKKSGNAAIVFSSGSVLANDGMGTNILSGFNNGQFSLTDKMIINDKPSSTTKSSVATQTEIKPNSSPEVVVPVDAVLEHVVPAPLISPEFIKILKLLATDIAIVAVVLLILFLIYFIIIYLWHRLLVMRIRQKNETKEVIAENKLNEVEYLLGQANAKITHQESLLALAERGAEELREENRKVAQITREKEGGFTKDIDTVHSEVAALERKLSESSRQIEESKVSSATLATQLAAEKAKNQKAEEYLRNAEGKIKEKEAVSASAIEGIKRSSLATSQSLVEALRAREAAKVEFAQLEGSLNTEKVKREGSERELADAKAEITSKERKIIEIENLLIESKSKIAAGEGALLAERTRVEQIQIEAKKLHALFKEEKEDFEKALQVTRDDAKKAEVVAKEKELSLIKSLESAQKALTDAQMNVSTMTERLAQAENVQKEAKTALVKQQELLAEEKTRSEGLLAAVSKYITPIAAETRAKLTKEEEAIAAEKARTDDILNQILKFSNPK